MKLNVFGTEVEIIRSDGEWSAYYCGNEGKKRKAQDIIIPSSILESEMVEYIADLCHEWSTQKNREVKVLSS